MIARPWILLRLAPAARAAFKTATCAECRRRGPKTFDAMLLFAPTRHLGMLHIYEPEGPETACGLRIRRRDRVAARELEP